MIADRFTSHTYTGRFAPSPSGPLHAGSLLAAVASFVDARSHAGRWLVRMEDLDPPREMPGADRLILETLAAHGLQWDGDVLYQSTRHARYREVLAELTDRGLAYRCACSRARLAGLGHVYDGYCRTHIPAVHEPCALRLWLPDEVVVFDDGIQGWQEQNIASTGDCVIHRKDGLFAYQLAVVVDDVDQGVTNVVRGSDILASTGQQIYLARLIGGAAMHYAHVPLLLDKRGQKLSKQNHAPALDNRQPSRNLCEALLLLGQETSPALADELPETVLKWAITHWDINKIKPYKRI